MIDTKNIESAIRNAQSLKELEELRVKYLGRKGVVTNELKKVGTMPAKDRAKAGKAANIARQQVEGWLKEAQANLRHAQVQGEAESKSVDLTAPVAISRGHIHPISQIQRDVIQAFWQLGFQVAEGPEVENDWYNFEALNLGPDHPARDMQDTFYLEDGNLPRTHTSNVQIRYMENHKPPIRIISPGKVYRNEDEGPKSVWMFTQLEGLVVDKGIGVPELKGTLLAMVEGILGKGTKIRLRPSYFPYTEPSIEVDASCVICKGKGCPTCSHVGWVELGGSGIVHPQVLRNVGIDPEIYSGFAFGFGLERLAIIKYQIDDIRHLWRPNLKFLEQF